RGLMRTVWLMGCFCVVFCAVILCMQWCSPTQDPLRSPQLLALKEKLRASPKDDQVKEQIRALDLQLRSRYFDQLHLKRTGGWFTLGFFALFLGMAKQALAMRRTTPMPQSAPDAALAAAKARTYSRLAVSAAGLLIAAAFLMW